MRPSASRVARQWVASAMTVEQRALQFLTDLGIEAEILYGNLVVYRTSMVEFSGKSGEQAAYDEVMKGLKDEFPDYRLFWSGRSDEWMGVEFHYRPGRVAAKREASALILYHGAQRWDGSPMITPHRQGQAEHGPGIYLTTSWETARKYSKGGGSVYRMTLSSPQGWLEHSNLDMSEVLPFVEKTLGRNKKALAVKESLERVAARVGTGRVPASVLVNAFVNNDIASGAKGPPLAEFLVEHGIDASLVTWGNDDWVVVFNPKLIHQVEKLTPKDVDAPGFAFDLPRVKSAKYQEKKKVPKADGKGETTVYVYGPRQIANRNKEKAERLEKLRHSISDLKKQVAEDLESKDAKKRLTALAIGLINETFERVGNTQSAEDGHFGVTGWLKQHLTFSKGSAKIKYVGKSGVEHEKDVSDKKLVSALKGCCEDKRPDDTILSFGSEDAEGLVPITSRDVNAYLKPFDITAKDLRGYAANQTMQKELRKARNAGPELPKDRKDKDKILKAEFKKALEATAEAVGHEAATLRTQYLVPGLEDSFMKNGTVIDNLKNASVDRVASMWLARVATKSDAEREDEEAERLVRPSPQKKPPRDDSSRNRVQQDDPDLGGSDKDLSKNYKDTGG